MVQFQITINQTEKGIEIERTLLHTDDSTDIEKEGAQIFVNESENIFKKLKEIENDRT